LYEKDRYFLIGTYG